MDPGDSLFLFTSSLTNTRYSTFAALSFLVYDHLLTFDAEKEFVWHSPWSFGKILFFFNRNFGLVALICNAASVFRAWEGLAMMLAVMSTEVILMTRIYAVYEGNKLILAVMGVLFAANIAGTALIVYLAPPGGTIAPHVHSSGCFVVDRGFSFFLCWLPAFGALNSPLLNVVVHDSIVYFLAIFASLFVNCLIWGLSPGTFNVELSGCWTIAASCSFGSRLLLNLREQYYKEQSFVGVEAESVFRLDLSG
ncbi:hypothetical protein JB92DRAFT_858406 [Gautieria morchelliformis]|nr:hypothetical protein JB92DRAFT_858406 [Gautieria morchelliformis]